MEAVRPNIVQAEFFLINIHCLDIQKLRHEVRSRDATSSPLKIVVRFYDEDSLVTNFALSATALERRQRELNDVYRSRDYLEAHFQERECTRIMRQLNECRRWRKHVALLQLQTLRFNSGAIAVKEPGHAFRRAEKNELHDLCESAAASTDAWILVFEHNHLCAELHRIVARCHF